MDSKITQLKKLSLLKQSNFDDISLGLRDIRDFHEILNLDRPPMVIFCHFVTKGGRSKFKFS